VHLDAGAHWDQAYGQGDTTRSWFQDEATASLRMLDAAELEGDLSIIDVGGGASTLIDSLLERGYLDLTVLDVSATGLETAQRRLGGRADRVEWIVTDLLTWKPARHYRVWHDRAVFHFLTHADQREQYLSRLRSATEIGSIAIIGCFAPDGPESCSGLPTVRFDAEGLAAQFGNEWRLEHADRKEHFTPSGAMQPFTWAQFTRLA